MKRLDAATYAEAFPERGGKRTRPERILQFGEGNFLRAFFDWMVHEMNARGLFDGSVVVVQPIRSGLASVLEEQDGLYTLLLRGVEEGGVVERREVIDSISRAIDPYADWKGFLSCAANPDLRFIVSNTTEAGIAWTDEPEPTERCPEGFPAKLAALLHARYRAVDGDPAKGFIVLPCELIEGNGKALRAAVARHAESWGLGAGFVDWIDRGCRFLDTLVDRIVPGYPREEEEALRAELGYEDRLMDSGEIFHLWVIEGDESVARELPLREAGLNVVWTDDARPYRERKVRILNGAHTMTVPVAFLGGKDEVRECVEDPAIRAFMERGVFEEILPGIALPRPEKEAFARSVLERFSNPFIRHELLSIALNSVSKFRVRVLPSLLDAVASGRGIPGALAFSLAALIAFHRGGFDGEGAYRGSRGSGSYLIKDEQAVLRVFSSAWASYDMTQDAGALCSAILSDAALWERDLRSVPGLEAEVRARLEDIVVRGMDAALASLMAGGRSA